MDNDSTELKNPSAILLFSFLQNSSNNAFDSELNNLTRHLPLPEFRPCSYSGDLDELQADGNVFGQPQAEGPADAWPDGILLQTIGAQLAEMGDALTAEIEAPFVNSLVDCFLERNMSREELVNRFSVAVRAAVQRIPSELEQEKVMLIIAMLLAKKVADAVPSLLERVFRTTVNFINENLLDAVNGLR